MSPQMLHCKRCRADAVGFLGRDDQDLGEMMKRTAFGDKEESMKSRPNVAVATREGMLVNEHLGEADELYVFTQKEDGSFNCVDARPTPLAGMGEARWENLADTFSDCRAMLVGGVGEKPLGILQSRGFQVIEMSGLVDEGLAHIYKGKELKTVRSRDMFKCGDSCGGNGEGCG